MRNMIRTLMVVLAAAAAVPASASSLTVITRHHVLVTDDTHQLVRSVFTDERLQASLTLDVYVVEGRPDTRENFEALSALDPSTWLSEVQWSLAGEDGQAVELPKPIVRSSNVRHRAENATTWEGSVDFGRMPAGDYVLTAVIRGLQSQFHFSVNSGQEPGLRDHYLGIKARQAADFAEFRALQLERLKNNPSRLDVLYALIDRSLVDGTLDETQGYFGRVLEAAEKNRRTATDEALAKRIENDIRQLRKTAAALPQLYSRRGEWSMTRDGNTGFYVIRNRANGALVRDFARER